MSVPLHINFNQLSAPAGDALPAFNIEVWRVLRDSGGVTETQRYRDAHLRHEFKGGKSIWMMDVFQDDAGAAPICPTIEFNPEQHPAHAVPYTAAINGILDIRLKP